MKRSEWWRAQYRQHRYLEHLTAPALGERLRHVLNNLVTITDDARIGVRVNDPTIDFWSAKWTHVLEEYHLRRVDFPYDVMRTHSLPAPLRPKHGPHSKGRRLLWSQVLPRLASGSIVKFGRLPHLRDAFEHGRIRLCPASFYDDPSLGPHRQDSETSRITYIHPFGKGARLIERADGTPVVDMPEIPILGNIEVRTDFCDYYVWCTSISMQPRLFIDFSADSALIIHNEREFAKRLAWATQRSVYDLPARFHGLDCEWKCVQYFDPYDPPRPPNDRLSVPWSKPLQFAYQREWRFVGIPFPTIDSGLPVLNVKLGPLFDVARLVYVGDLEGPRFHDAGTALVPSRGQPFS